MARAKKSNSPPWLTLGEAIEDILAINEQGGGILSKENFSHFKKTSTKSSKFQMEMVALRGYGLIHAGQSDIELTPLAKSIVTPSSDNDRIKATLAAFHSIPLFNILHERFRGGFLADAEFLSNIIENEYNATKAYKKKWASCFIESGKDAGLLHSEGGKIRVLSVPESDKRLAQSTPASASYPEKQAAPESGTTSTETFPVAFDANRTAHIPFDIDESDLEYLRTVLEAYIKKTKGKK